MMTWYEKYYGVPPPVKVRRIDDTPLIKQLKEEEKKKKESAWYRAKHDYIEYLRKQNKNTDAI